MRRQCLRKDLLEPALLRFSDSKEWRKNGALQGEWSHQNNWRITDKRKKKDCREDEIGDLKKWTLGIKTNEDSKKNKTTATKMHSYFSIRNKCGKFILRIGVITILKWLVVCAVCFWASFNLTTRPHRYLRHPLSVLPSEDKIWIWFRFLSFSQRVMLASINSSSYKY